MVGEHNAQVVCCCWLCLSRRRFGTSNNACAVRTTSSRKFVSDAAHLGPELMVSAWPEPPSVIPSQWSAEATAGASSERKRPTELASDPSHIGRQWRCGQHAVGTR